MNNNPTKVLHFQIDPPSETQKDNAGALGLTIGGDDVSSDDARTSLQSPRSQNTSREEDESSNANESDSKSPNQRYPKQFHSISTIILLTRLSA